VASFKVKESKESFEAGQVTKLLQAWSRGDRSALDRLAPLIYAELRKLARFHMSHEAAGHTLQPTALINEAFLKLVDIRKGVWKSRNHFFAAASQIMRRVLVDYARKKRSIKRGREVKRVPWEEAMNQPADISGAADILMFDEALSRLEAKDPRKVRVMEAWFFSGMTVEEIAAAVGIGASTVKRDLDFAKVWLARELRSIQTHDE
jgi:RNA polymerase sigma factor (TIGR02999 family)